MHDRFKQFVILPARHSGSRAATAMSAAASLLKSEFLPSEDFKNIAGVGNVRIRVLDSIREDGPKLVEIREEDIDEFRLNQTGLVVAPVVYYRLARVPRHEIRTAPVALPSVVSSPVSPLQLQVIDEVTGAPVVGANVVAFTDFAARLGAHGISNANGTATLNFGLVPSLVERMYVYPPLAGYWGAYKENISDIATLTSVSMRPVDPSQKDCVRHHHGAGNQSDGSGVRVAVIDTGVGPHLALPNATGDGDNGDGHGTHVAGIIGEQGRGVAPGVEIKSYRVFASHGIAANYTIAKAIDHAVQDHCDLLNLSLSIDPVGNPAGVAFDPVVSYSLEDARLSGALPIAAAGNDGRNPVNYPACDPMCVAVSAIGRLGTFPNSAAQQATVLAPFGSDPKNFIADFSNVGSEVDVCGPGVGVVSTVPGGHGVMDGTSMACPAVVGMMARLLSSKGNTLNMPRDDQRSAAILRMMTKAASLLGFGRNFEGYGLIS